MKTECWLLLNVCKRSVIGLEWWCYTLNVIRIYPSEFEMIVRLEKDEESEFPNIASSVFVVRATSISSTYVIGIIM